MKRWGAAAATVVAVVAAVEGVMWWRNVHPKEHGDAIEDELIAV